MNESSRKQGRSPDVFEDLGSGINREWLYNRQVVVLTFWSSSRETVDAWANVGKELMENWPQDRPYLCLLDASRIVLTPYARKVAADLTAVRPEMQGRIAVVVAASTLGHIIRLFANHPSLKRHRERRVFFSRDVGLDWLQEMVSKADFPSIRR